MRAAKAQGSMHFFTGLLEPSLLFNAVHTKAKHSQHTKNHGLAHIFSNRGSYMSAHVRLNLLNKLGKEIKCEAC